MTVPSRHQTIEKLARASARGRLGLFVGSGFSIGLTKGEAPNWRELLERAAERLEISMPAPEDVYGTASPRIATNLVGYLRDSERQKAEEEGEDATKVDVARRATWRFKSAIAELCQFDPAEEERDRWSKAVQEIDPAWIVTTNYDLLIESLVPNSSALLPNDLLTIPRRGPLPVFHLHGHRLSPNSLVVSDEDYTCLLRPGDYRQRKLSLLFSESVVLVLGYGLGDMNVLSAIDLAAAYSHASEDTGVVIQALWKDTNASEAPYSGILGETVLEIQDIPDLLQTIAAKRDALRAEATKHAEAVRRLITDEAARASLANDSLDADWMAIRAHADLAGNRARRPRGKP